MNKNKIKDLLKQLGEMLVELEQKTPIRLMMIGGAFMLTQVGNRDITDDIDRLKLIKRSMYGRAKLPLLRQRVLWSA